MTLTTEDVHTALAVQLSHFYQSTQVTVPGSVDCLHWPEDNVGCRLTTTKLGRILNVVKHQGGSMQKVDGALDHSDLFWRHFIPNVQRIDGYVTNTLGWQ